MALLRPPTRRRRRWRAGYTLVEVVVGMLITSVIVTSVFSAAITAKSSAGKNDRRLIASAAARNLSAMLKRYVTGCDCDVATGACSTAPGPGECPVNDAAAGAFRGPNPGNGVNQFSLTDLTVPPNGVRDSCDANCGAAANCYALKQGPHCVQGLLPDWFEAAPYNARVRYTVTNSANIEGRPLPQVDVDVRWDE